MKYIIRVENLENIPETRPLVAMDNIRKLLWKGKTPEPVGPPNDEIWYTSEYEEPIELADEEVFYDINGNILTFVNTYIDGKGILKFNNNVASIGESAFAYCFGLTSINIPNGVTSIGDSAFENCSSLTSINIPNGVTRIGNSAFYGCSSLTSINIPNSVTTIDSDAFYGCSSLTSINIPNGVTCISDSTFDHCSSLTSINIPNGVISIGNNAFYGCSSLTSIVIPASVTSIDSLYVFTDCTSLASITVDQNNTVYDSRNNCNAIIQTSTNTLIYGCKNTIIPNSVIRISSYAFYKHSSLTSINIPSSILSIGLDAFSNTGLTSINIPSSVTNLAQAFKSCSNLSSIVVDQNNTVYDSRNNCNAIIQTSTNTLIVGCKNTIIPNTVTSIDLGAFYGNKNLTSITIPSSVTNIGQQVFASTELTSITIPSSVTNIGQQAFASTELTSITIPSSVTSIGRYAFLNCRDLTSVTCEAVTPPTIGNQLFDSRNYPIYVPAGSVETYKAATGWSTYATRIRAIQ